MAITQNKRRTPTFTSDGVQTVFSFDFKVFAPSDIQVLVNATDDWFEPDSALTYETDFYVALNTDQDGNPGGSVTLVTPLAAGTRLVVASAIEPLQPIVITRTGGFYPDTLNEGFDRAIALIQELKDSIERALVVPSTSNQKPEDVVNDLMSAQSDAQESAEEAKLYRNEAKKARDEILGEQSTVIAAIEQTGLEQKNIVQAEGDVQAERLEIITQETLVGYGVGGAQQTWALTADAPTGSELTLPNAMTYINGRNHLRLSWNGLVLYPEENYEEMGTKDTASTQFKVLFDMKEGDVINAWTVPLGRGDVTDAIEEIAVIRDSVAEMSRTVAYRETQNKKV